MAGGKSCRRRRLLLESLEPRQLLARDFWHNPLWPIDALVDQNGVVAPIDALVIINELNEPVYSDPSTQRLPASLPDGAAPPYYFDVSCDGFASPIDALLVINELNDPQGAPGWQVDADGGGGTGAGRVDSFSCSPRLVEGNSFRTELRIPVVAPTTPSSVRVTFDSPQFDASSTGMVRDAFEVVVEDAQGNPLALPVSQGREASFNWTEGLAPAAGAGTVGGTTTATINLSTLPAGTSVTVIARLINNDADDATSVVIRGVDVVPAAGAPPRGAVASAERATSAPFVWQDLDDVTSGLAAVYGRTTHVADESLLAVDFQLRNDGPGALVGPLIVALDGFSDPTIQPLDPDGRLPDGRPYWNFTADSAAPSLAHDATTGGRTLEFRNPTQSRFTFRWQAYGTLNVAPSAFTSVPLRQIEAGRTYRYSASAADPEQGALSYSLIAGPEGMTIEAETGRVVWQPTATDVGDHWVTLRAVDPYGLFIEQTFTLSVVLDLPNRPPTFVSSPETAATVAGAFDVVTVAVGASPAGLAVGDFGSGRLSLVAASQGTQTVTVTPGLGDERFGAPQTNSVGEPPPTDDVLVGGVDVDLGLPRFVASQDENALGGLAQGDFNGDGRLDLATSTYYAYRLPDGNVARTRALAINLGRGDGTFEPAAQLTVSGPAPNDRDSTLGSLAADDFDGDGRLDLLGYDAKIRELHFFRGLGSGRFANDAITPLAASVISYRVADMNGDGRLDLVALAGSSDTLGILFGNGDGTFQSFQQIASRPGAGYYHDDYAIGDLNGDGRPDIAVGDWIASRLEVLLADGAGGFLTPTLLPAYEPEYPFGSPPGTTQPTTVLIGDFDGDGHADLLYGVNTTNARGGGFALYRGDGSGTTFTFADGSAGTAGRPVNMLRGENPVDLNGDGALDFIAAGLGYSGYGVVVGMNRGDGTFDVTTYQNSTNGVTPTGTNTFYELGVLAGDYDGDGRADLAIPATSRTFEKGFSGVSILRAAGPDRFQAPYEVPLRVPQAPPYVTVSFAQAGDFNNDGFADIWSAVFQGPSIVRLGNGDGTFQPSRVATPYIGNEFLGPGFTADFNHDGNLDIFWFGGGGVQGGPLGRYLAALGNGDGSFQITFAQTVPGMFYGANVVAPGDFNGDGYVDFVARGGGAFGPGPFIDVWLNDPDHPGTFVQSYRRILPTDSNSQAITVGDFDDDGRADILAIGRADGNSSQRSLFWMPGLGDGTFAEPPALPVFSGTDLVDPRWMASGDLNHDGHLDVVTTASYHRAAVMLGRGDGSFGSPTMFTAGTYFASVRNAYLIDMNGDGDLDFVNVSDSTSRGSVNIRLGNGDGTFGEQLSYDGGDGAGELAFADFDNDGLLDVGMTRTGTLSAETIFPGVRPGLSAVATGDVDGDGRLDVLAVNSSNDRLKILLGRGDETFIRQPDVLTDVGPRALALGDLNGDGRLDVVTANRSGQSLSILLGDGDAHFARTDLPLGHGPTDMLLADLNADGHPDVVATDELDRSLAVLLGDGAGLFPTTFTLPLGDRPGAVTVGDWNGDGKVDVALLLPTTQRLMLLLGDGSGHFAAPTYVNLSSAGADVATNDLNQDGRADLIVTLPDEGKTVIYFGLSGGRFALPQTIRVGERPMSLALQDADGDGRVDILVANAGDDTASVILNHYDPSRVYVYPSSAIDPDDDPVTYELTQGPDGALLDPTTGRLAWAPSADQLGPQDFVLRATDGRGGSSTQSFTVYVSPPTDNSPPIFTSLPPTTVSNAESFEYDAHAGDFDQDSVRYRLLNGPSGAEVDPLGGQVTWDPRGVALSMNRAGDPGYVTIPDTPSLNVASLTAEGWFQFARINSAQNLIIKPNPQSEAFGLRLYFGSLQGVVGDGSTTDVVSIPWTPVLGQWYHLAFTFDAATKRMALLVDGQEVVAKTTTSAIGPSSAPLYFAANNLYSGALTDIRIWDVARTPAQIQTTLGRRVAPDAAGLVADYRFLEGDAQSVLDSSLHRNDGRLDGSWWPTRVPGLAPVQDATFTIGAEDGRGGFAQQSFELHVVDPRTGEIQGTVFEDRDGDALRQTNEPFMADLLVYLDDNGNGIFDVSEPSSRTSATGVFRLPGLLPGDHRLAVEPRAGLTNFASVTVATSASQTTTRDIGLAPEASSQIRGRVSLDLDGDGLVREELPVYFADFAAADVDLSPWSHRTITTSPTGQKFLGEFASEVVSLEVGGAATPLPPHDVLRLSFDFLALKSWDGNHSAAGPDRLRFSLDGREYFLTSFSNTSETQSYPGAYPAASNGPRSGATSVNTLGYSFFGDSTYRLTFEIPHTASTARFEFQGVGVSTTPDESWGLNQVRVTAPEPIAARWQVFADLDRDGTLDPQEPSTTTDARGDYALAGLAAGDYAVRVAPPSGWSTVTPSTGGRDVTLAASSTSSGADFTVARLDPSSPVPPLFVTVPTVTATARELYRYAAVAVDLAAGSVSYALAIAPEGMTIDPATGVIAWTPAATQQGNSRVVVVARNAQGATGFQDYAIQVAAPNTAPIVTSTPPAEAYVGRRFLYDVRAQDAESDALSFSLIASPAGAVIGATSGRLTWTPSAGQLGAQTITVQVQDVRGASIRRSFVIDVLTNGPTSSLPWAVTPPRADATADQRYVGRVVGADALGRPLTTALVAGPAGLELAPDGTLAWTPAVTQLGHRTFDVRFTDADGADEVQSFAIDVRASVSNSPPRIVSSAPPLAVIGNTYAYDVQTTDSDGDALAFELLAGPSGMSVDATRGTLRWVPAVDQAGPFTATIRVVDPGAGETTQTFRVTTRHAGGPPVITSVPPTEAVVGRSYLYSVEALDPENDPLAYSLLVAPDGMTIDVDTGDITWTPTPEQVGSQVVIVRVADGAGGATTQGFAVRAAAGATNLPPSISTSPPRDGVVGTLYEYLFAAIDPEAAAVHYEVRRGPSGMSVDAQTGRVVWTPGAGQAGRALVTLAAFDAQGAAALQSFAIDVLAANHAPTITSLAPGRIPAGASYRYDVIARDVDADPLSYTLVASPAGMTIDPFGRVRWQTTPGDIGHRQATIGVRDPRGGQTTQVIEFDVVPDESPPRVTVLPTTGGWPWEGPIVVFVSAVDDVGVTDVQLTVNGRVVPLDAQRTVRLRYEDWGFGPLLMTATARDAAGNVGVGEGTSVYRNPDIDYETNPAGPIASITSPSEADSVTGLVTIRGTAGGPDFKEYRLSYRRADQFAFVEFAHATTAVTDGVLGVWDTTLLENDAYVLRLEAIDVVGSSSVIDVSIGVSGGFKLGDFQLSFADLTIPVAGIPITVARTYDTLRSDRAADLGYGWRLEYRNTNLRTSLPKSGLEDLGIYTPFRGGTKVYLTLPGGVRQGFTFTPEIRVLPGFGQTGGLAVATPRFTPDRGVTSTLKVRGGTLLVNEFGELYAAGGLPWNPAAEDFGGGYTLTTAGGEEYFIDGGSGLMTSARDRNGNTLTFGERGVASSSGVELVFERDARGRITSIADPAGQRVVYGYDARGDLTSVTDRGGAVTRFVYRTDRPHYLDSVIDPLGRTGAKTSYGADGRLASLKNADGSTLTSHYDLNANQFTTIDPHGRPTTTTYDAQGQVVQVVGPDGARTQYGYSPDGLLTAIRDPLDRLSQFQYDAAGHLAATIDPLGNTSRFRFDAFGQLLSATDPLGNTTSSTYDARGNETSYTDPSGATASATYDARGLRTSFTDARGSTSQFAYDSAGRLASFVDALGQTTTFAVDALGNPIRERTVVATGAGDQIIEWNYAYDVNGEFAGVTAPRGGQVELERDAAGNVVRSTDALGRAQTLSFTAGGLQSGVTYPDGGTLHVQYDAGGREASVSLPNGGELHYEYDAAGNRTATILPDGTRLTSSYDLAGQATGRSQAGDAETDVYDAAGRLVETRAADGSTVRYAYDAAGRRTSAVDSLGNVTRFEYDDAGRMTAVELPGGERRELAYDAAGNVIRRSDAAGSVWTFDYGPTSLIDQTIDALGNSFRFDWTGLGQIAAATNPLGQATRFAYDLDGHLATRTSPLGAVQHFTYDAFGQLTSQTDATGATVTYSYAANGLPATITSSQGVEVRTYDAGHQLVQVDDPRGTTLTPRDVLGRLESWTGPNGIAVTFGRDTAGRVSSIATSAGSSSREFATNGDLVQLTDADGVMTDVAYDASGRPVRSQTSNGVVLIREYDALGRALAFRWTDVANTPLYSLTFVRDANGRISTAIESTGRTTRYAYDDAGRLLTEISTQGAVTSRVDYEYDGAGNLRRRVDGDGAQTFVVDADDQLQSDGQWTYQWDAAGHLVRRDRPGQSDAFIWDARGRLSRVVRSGAISQTIDYAYDYDGLLAERRVDGVVTRFVWDRSSGLPQLLEERDGANALVRRYESDGQSIRRFTDATGSSGAYLVDQFGTVRGTVIGGVVTTYQYDAYGRPIGPHAPGVGYTGGWTDEATGMVFLRTRWYSPDMARFTSTDGAPIEPTEPATLNRYTYAGDDPVNRFDPSGQTTSSELAFVQTINGYLAKAFFSFLGLSTLKAIRAGEIPGLSFFKVLGNLTSWPTGIGGSASFGLSAGFTGMELGLEAIRFTPHQESAIFGFIGFGKGGTDVLSKLEKSVSVKLLPFAVFDTPRAELYEGFFWSLSFGSSSKLFPAASLSLSGVKLDGKNAGVSLAWSPTPTFFTPSSVATFSPTNIDTNSNDYYDTARYSHTLALTADVGIGFGVSYYFLLFSAGGDKGAQVLPDFWKQIFGMLP